MGKISKRHRVKHVSHHTRSSNTKVWSIILIGTVSVIAIVFGIKIFNNSPVLGLAVGPAATNGFNVIVPTSAVTYKVSPAPIHTFTPAIHLANYIPEDSYCDASNNLHTIIYWTTNYNSSTSWKAKTSTQDQFTCKNCYFQAGEVANKKVINYLSILKAGIMFPAAKGLKLIPPPVSPQSLYQEILSTTADFKITNITTLSQNSYSASIIYKNIYPQNYKNVSSQNSSNQTLRDFLDSFWLPNIAMASAIRYEFTMPSSSDLLKSRYNKITIIDSNNVTGSNRRFIVSNAITMPKACPIK